MSDDVDNAPIPDSPGGAEPESSAASSLMLPLAITAVIFGIAALVLMFRGGGDNGTAPPVDVPPASAIETPSAEQIAAFAAIIAQQTADASATAAVPTATLTPRPTYAPPPRAGGSGSGGGSSSSSSKVADAEKLRDELLATAKSAATAPGADMSTGHPGFGILEAWRAKYPALEFAAGSSSDVAYRATLPVNKSEDASKENPYIFAFAVRDSSGGCAGGTIAGFPLPDTFATVGLPPGSKCRPDAVTDIYVGR